MKPLLMTSLVSLTVLVVGAARADGLDAIRIGATGTGGLAEFHRSFNRPQRQTGVTLGGELRVHPASIHGFLVGFMHGGGLFGPTVTTLDADYSLCITCPRSLERVTGAVYLGVGPSLGFVDRSAAPFHHVLGGRVSAAGDLHLGSFTLGLMLGYRGGIPLDRDDSLEGALTLDLRIGVAFDVAKQ